jgi:hypothetical protein
MADNPICPHCLGDNKWNIINNTYLCRSCCEGRFHITELYDIVQWNKIRHRYIKMLIYETFGDTICVAGRQKNRLALLDSMFNDNTMRVLYPYEEQLSSGLWENSHLPWQPDIEESE